ncbi:MAG: hypothetical protein LQ346_003753 [Caloplaca aetnensis]|nr:MAG: hypothetical protein LQ346_003753 [Caloplaca aetnensis]
MARPFDDHVGSSRGTATYPTSVAATRTWDAYPASIKYEDAPQSFSTTGPSASTQSSKNQKSLRLTKIKSSPSHGALAAARLASRSRGHRRGRSASETTSPITPTFTSNQFYTSIDPLPSLAAPATAYTKPYPMAPPTFKAKVKIKPLLRKISSQDQNTVDLSKSVAENEGLGLYTSSTAGESRKTSSDVGHPGYHNRTASEASHVSATTISSHQKYGAQYIHPMRQTPLPYTPPLTNSFANSVESGESATGGPAAVPKDLIHHDHEKQHMNLTSYAPLPSPRRTRPPLHVRTGSTPRLASSSQTNLPGTPSSLRLQTDNIDTPVAMPSTRTSFDSMFRKRSRANTIEDPVARAAQVAVLRKEFDERERFKDEQRREQEARKAQKEAKRQQKRDESQQRKSETIARKRAQSNTMSEKSATRAYQAQQDTMSRQTTGGGGSTAQRPQTRGSSKRAGGAGKAVANKWQLFVFWLKTMLLKLKRKMSGGLS